MTVTGTAKRSSNDHNKFSVEIPKEQLKSTLPMQAKMHSVRVHELFLLNLR